MVAPSGEWICSGARNSELKMLVWRELVVVYNNLLVILVTQKIVVDRPL